MRDDGGSQGGLQVVYNVDRILDCHTHLTYSSGYAFVPCSQKLHARDGATLSTNGDPCTRTIPRVV